MSVREAVSVLVLRDSPLRVLMVRRADRGMFASALVFPGGAVEPSDRPDGAGGDEAEGRRRSAALREVAEEAGVAVGDLHWFARWITPVGSPRRWDTHFYVATCGDDEVARPDLVEVEEALWVEPAAALEAAAAGERRIPFPTLANLHLLAGLTSAREAIALAGTRPRTAVEPLVELGPEGRRVRIPAASGYPILEAFTPA